MKQIEKLIPVRFGAFIKTDSRRIKNNFIHAIDENKTIFVFYQKTDSSYTQNKTWDVSDEAAFVGNEIG